MNSKIKAVLYTFLIGTVLVPVLYMSGVYAATTCESGYPVTGSTTASAYANTGSLDFTSGSVCIGDDGVVSGQVESSNIGTIYFGSHGASATVDLGSGVWAGTAYAPLNPYNQASTQGVLFDLSNVQTNLATGAITGYANSTNLGELSFAGASQTLPVLEVGIDFQVDTFGTTRTSDGYPVADGGTSGYTLKATLDFSGVSTDIAESFNFTAVVSAADGSDLRLDQIDGGGAANDALTGDSTFVYDGYDSVTETATYHMDISSFAPTSDAYCGGLGSLEYCNYFSSNYTYGIGDIVIGGSTIREFTWGGLTTDVYPLGMEFVGTATVTDAAQNLPFAPVFEMDDFGVIGSDGVTRADSSDEVPTLAEGVQYDFTGTLVKNGTFSSFSDKKLNIQYSISDSPEYSFGEAACGASEFAIGFAPGSVLGRTEFTDIELCPADGASLDKNTEAVVNNFFELTFAAGDRTVRYGSEYFTFADMRAGVWENPRAYITGTVSGLVESDDATIVGNVVKMELRDQLFKEFTKITRGVEPTSDGGRVNSSWEAAVGGVELDGGDVLYFTGDSSENSIKIDGGSLSGVSATIVVVGADVFIDGNITKVDGEGELGIIVFAEDGVGGNMYVDSDVTDLQANMFLDGSLFRGDEDGNIYGASDLKNQFYLFGSIVSENTIGDDDITTDLSYTSYFQVCCIDACEFDAGGELTTSMEDLQICTGYDQSSYDGDYWMVPVIVEYSPPSAEMPIFSVGGGMVGR